MAPSFLTPWLIFKKESGKWTSSNKICNEYHSISLYSQANMDYSICQALKQFPRHVLALIIYDICCQWCIHFRQRVSESEFLEFWESLEITPAVGKWHLAAHISECFYKFSLNFIEGAAEVDGEIMETLWSVLDQVAGLTQGMSLAHRQEVLDEYMNDSNWRKITRIGIKHLIFIMEMPLIVPLADTIATKWTRAKDGVKETRSAYQELTERLDKAWIEEWTRQERVAMLNRGEALKIYMVASEKGEAQFQWGFDGS
jgi:hypothetical protein